MSTRTDPEKPNIILILADPIIQQNIANIVKINEDHGAGLPIDLILNPKPLKE